MEQGENQSVRTAFHVGSIPNGYRLDYEPHLFNTRAHRQLQAVDGWIEFHLLQVATKKVLISACFNVKAGLARSPVRAPFGGFEFGKSVSAELIFDFINRVEQEFAKARVSVLEVLSPAEIYSQTQPMLTVSLLNHGFEIIQAEPGACLVVDETPLRDKMNKDKRARLRLCEKAGLIFKKLPLSKLPSVYAFIADCRTKQKRKLSMTFDELNKTVQAFPKSFFIVGVFDKQKMIGACVCVRVSTSVVYTFYSAHEAEYDKMSPRVFLIVHLYAWCQKNKIWLLDLGTSALDGKPNFPLLDFKLRMGATLTPKYKFRKLLA